MIPPKIIYLELLFLLLKTLDYYVQIAKTNDKCVFDRSHFKIYVIFL